jgi:hypothetical protein
MKTRADLIRRLEDLESLYADNIELFQLQVVIHTQRLAETRKKLEAMRRKQARDDARKGGQR